MTGRIFLVASSTRAGTAIQMRDMCNHPSLHRDPRNFCQLKHEKPHEEQTGSVTGNFPVYPEISSINQKTTRSDTENFFVCSEIFKLSEDTTGSDTVYSLALPRCNTPNNEETRSDPEKSLDPLDDAGPNEE